MAIVTLTCPHCGFSKGLAATRLPPAGSRAACPHCKTVSTLEALTAQTPPAAVSAAVSPPSYDAPPGPGVDSLSVDSPQPLGPGAPPPSPPPPPVGSGTEEFPPPATPPPAQRQRLRTLTFTFTGNAREYFGIWIVNTLLRVVTLGIYSPWAKVRKRRYFYCSTLLDNAPFDYLADPLKILKGWFIAGAFFLLYSLSSRISPLFSSLFSLIFLVLFPWVVVRSRIFNLRNSTHRNIRFSFRPDYREAYTVFLGWPLLAALTLGILAPVALHRQKRFLVENAAYGTTRFTFAATPRDYYRVFIPVVITAIVGAALVASAVLSGKPGPAHPHAGLMTIPLVILFFVFYYIVGVWVPTVITNITWSATHIGNHRFRCDMRPRDLAWIYVSNAVAIPLSVGLLAPWAAVRLVRYRLAHLTLAGAGGLDSVAAAADTQVDATGEELGDMLGFDLGL